MTTQCLRRSVRRTLEEHMSRIVAACGRWVACANAVGPGHCGNRRQIGLDAIMCDRVQEDAALAMQVFRDDSAEQAWFREFEASGSLDAWAAVTTLGELADLGARYLRGNCGVAGSPWRLGPPKGCGPAQPLVELTAAGFLVTTAQQGSVGSVECTREVVEGFVSRQLVVRLSSLAKRGCLVFTADLNTGSVSAILPESLTGHTAVVLSVQRGNAPFWDSRAWRVTRVFHIKSQLQWASEHVRALSVLNPASGISDELVAKCCWALVASVNPGPVATSVAAQMLQALTASTAVTKHGCTPQPGGTASLDA